MLSRGRQMMLGAGETFEKIALSCRGRKLLHKNSGEAPVEGRHLLSQKSKKDWVEEEINMVEKVIEANTEISVDHLTPELKLHLLTPNCRLYNEAISQNGSFVDPYLANNYKERVLFHEAFWSIYWPGGQALTRFILDRGAKLLEESKGGTNVLDMGSGCGASAIAAKMIGASRVIANDIDPVACVAAKLNALLNGVEIETTSKNLLETGAEQYGSGLDIILVGDLLYDDETAESLIPWLEETVRFNGSRIYLGDPGRHALTDALKSRMELQQEYPLPENVRQENNGYSSATVWRFRSN